MSSSNSVLRSAPIGEHVFHLDGRSIPRDPAVEAAIEDARARAYEEGLRAGRAAGVAEALERVDVAEQRARSLLATASSTAVREIADGMSAATRDLVGLGLDIARNIVGSAADHWAETLSTRLMEVMAILDDDTLVVRMSPEDTAAVEHLLGPAVTVRQDPSLDAGDAVVEGTWARADLTLAQAWRTIEDDLGVGSDE